VYAAGRGAWFGAWLDGQLLATLGVVVTDGRGRYQSVDTHPSARRRGLASRLVHDAGVTAVERFGAERLVIVTDSDNHALGVYRGVGFREAERTMGACWWPAARNASRHPRLGAAAASS
jgi:ribosomal protein S18 acetylase RimI-like enzyme